MDIKNISILIVEDDELYALKLKNWAKEKAQKLEIVDNAERGSHFVSLLRPDIIFLDNQLPKLQGKEVIDLYKDISPESIIILMSASYNTNDVSEGAQNGADYLFDKKVTEKKDILNMIHRILESDNLEDKPTGWLWNLLTMKS